MRRNSLLISPVDLAEHAGRDGLSVVDASWYLTDQGRLSRPEFEAARVPGAVYFDQDAIVDPASSLPHALPSAEVFAEAVGALGIRETDTIVVYDGLGLFSAPRVWWMFRLFGANDVRILDGGFPAWRAADLPVESGPPQAPEPHVFNASRPADVVATKADMREASENGTLQIADARSAERFAGRGVERPGVRAGHIPGARNLPFLDLARDGRLKDAAELEAVFEAAGIDTGKPVVTTCGSGVTAAVINLALESVGHSGSRLYDGSWSEWGSAKDTPVETA